MTDPNFLTIGAFASASRLSQKALRLYDDLGLLPPVQVDEQSGYRYYSPTQLPQARQIGLLRQLDMPLADVRALLDTPPSQQVALLRAWLARTEREHGQRRALARYLIQQWEGEPTMTSYDVQERFVPAQQVAGIARRVYVKDLPATIQSSMQTLLALIPAQGAAFAGAPVVIYHGEVNADSDGPIEVCVPYTGHLTPAGDVVLRLEPEHHEAFVILTKAQFEFPAILGAYDATAMYAQAHGESGPLHCREVYPYDWDRAGPDDPAGEVAWPFTPQS